MCQFHTSSLIFLTFHHVAILFALCSRIVTHIFQSLHVCAFCVNNPFPKFVTRGIIWIIGWDNQYCNQHLPPEQYSFDCKYVQDYHKSSWITGKHLSHLWEKYSKPLIFYTLQLLPSECTQELYPVLRWWIYRCSDRSTLVLQNM